jgi:threonine 3-dehydrogenase
MRTPVVLVTGAGGEIGHGLITRLAAAGRTVVTIDIAPLEHSLAKLVRREFTGSILEKGLLERVLAEFDIDLVFHLAALLSHGRPVTFMYPSSIAAYGLPDLDTKHRAGRVREDEWNTPTTMYGCNKLYCEHLGRYYARHYKQLAAESTARRVDFRCVRFPGLISALTVPSGGTSDYAPEMIHAAARREPHACFVRPDTRIPFMAMPDAVDALMKLAQAPPVKLTRTAYNLRAFNPSAEEICHVVRNAFPDAEITWQTDAKRQGIVDSWPEDVDDGAARNDWGFSPRYDFVRAFDEYLIPTIRERYK